MNLSEKMENSSTSIIKTVFPNTTNHYDTLFGGTALQWIDEAAFISATRFCRQRIVTVSFDRTDFHKPIPAGNFVEIISKVVKIGTTSIQVKTDVYLEHMYSEKREKAIEALVTFVAIDDERNPIPVTIK